MGVDLVVKENGQSRVGVDAVEAGAGTLVGEKGRFGLEEFSEVGSNLIEVVG